jgi:hypothetical protein
MGCIMSGTKGVWALANYRARGGLICVRSYPEGMPCIYVE